MKDFCEKFMQGAIACYLTFDDYYINYDKRIAIFFRDFSKGNITAIEQDAIQRAMTHSWAGAYFKYEIECNKLLADV